MADRRGWAVLSGVSSLIAQPIARAANDLLFDAGGRALIDLFTAHGTTWLGHCNPAVVTAISDQLTRVWATGGLETEIRARARAAIESFFPETHELACVYSTGMEAGEFALRLARVAAGKIGALGFERAMHGKSAAMSSLGWDNCDGAQVSFVRKLPFVDSVSEEGVLESVERELAKGGIGAVFLEPMHGSGGGWPVSAGFARSLIHLCRRFRAVSIFDEILTGFHRTGPLFTFCGPGGLADKEADWPDVVLIGKAMGNGFPVSAVVANRCFKVMPEMLPGSTFAGNALACAAIVATLREIRQIGIESRVAMIEQIVRAELALPLAQSPARLRGRGAFWVMELPSEIRLEQVRGIVEAVYHRGVFVSYAGRQIRVLPAATIERGHLENACRILVDEVSNACRGIE